MHSFTYVISKVTYVSKFTYGVMCAFTYGSINTPGVYMGK